jgi:hypothetical protein
MNIHEFELDNGFLQKFMREEGWKEGKKGGTKGGRKKERVGKSR